MHAMNYVSINVLNTHIYCACPFVGNRPVQVPMYEKLHPEQPMHGFSYISPAQPLLHDSLAAKVLGAANSNISAIGGAAGDGK